MVSIISFFRRKLTVCIFPSISEMMSATHVEDLATCLRNWAGLLPNVPEPAKIENFFPKIKRMYYKENTTTEDGTTEVSVTFLTFVFILSQTGMYYR
jgi:hypothetical protein